MKRRSPPWPARLTAITTLLLFFGGCRLACSAMGGPAIATYGGVDLDAVAVQSQYDRCRATPACMQDYEGRSFLDLVQSEAEQVTLEEMSALGHSGCAIGERLAEGSVVKLDAPCDAKMGMKVRLEVSSSGILIETDPYGVEGSARNKLRAHIFSGLRKAMSKLQVRAWSCSEHC